MIPADQKTAIELGSSRYFTGKPCRKGHISSRRTSNGKCISCASAWQKQKMLSDESYATSQKEIHCRLKREWRKKNPRTEETRMAERNRYHARIDESRAKGREKARRRMAKIENKLHANITSYMWRFISRNGCDGKSKVIHNLCGYTIQELKAHLERQFTTGMSWENYGRDGWHVDHIVPRSLFDLSDERQFRKCWELANLRPLWAKDNKQKSNKSVFLI